MGKSFDFLEDLEKFEATPESAGYDLRLDLADIIFRYLKEKKWTQAQLAKYTGMKAPYLTRIMQASQNCTFEVAGKILFALGIKAKLAEAREFQTKTIFINQIIATNQMEASTISRPNICDTKEVIYAPQTCA